ncbi:MAG: orotidine-5'-phosphate decarboxylase [Clostridiales bacterium]|nr:orotidine-5'-phosphate decarboxylase [Clostridiales bacterium]
MVIDQLIEQIRYKKNPCIVGIDPEWGKIPACYKAPNLPAHASILHWSLDVIDAVADIVPAIKPQMAFFEVYGAEGIRIHQKIIKYAHEKGLIVIDDSKRNDIGNTAKAYAYAHLAKEGPINADFLTISPFLGTDSIQPFIDTAIQDGKGVFVLVKTSNPSSVEISEAINPHGEKIVDWLALLVNMMGQKSMGEHGYSSVGAVVGATFPEKAKALREIMKHNFFLVPGYGAQGGKAKDIPPFFRSDGLGAIISSSRNVLYKHLEAENFYPSISAYKQLVKQQAQDMQKNVYQELKSAYSGMLY